MKGRKLISIGKIIAMAIVILGIIHDISTFTPLIKDGLACLTPDNLRATIFMSLICGTSFILCGLLIIILFRRIEQFTFLIVPVFAIGVFLAISGVLSVVYMVENPFAWIMLILNLSMFGIIIKLRKTIK